MTADTGTFAYILVCDISSGLFIYLEADTQQPLV